MPSSRLEEREYAPHRDFIYQHSGRGDLGPQCHDHPSLGDMQWPKVQQAMQDHLGGVPIGKMQYLVLCHRYGVQTYGDKHGRTGRPRVPVEQKRKADAERQRRRHARLRGDPEAIENYRQQHRRGNPDLPPAVAHPERDTAAAELLAAGSGLIPKPTSKVAFG